MAWSTQQLAELAGTTVKAIRHYHRVELLPEPERAPNGYKQYQVQHLIRVLQIRRLRELGVPLSQVPAFGDGDDSGDHEETIRLIDAGLEATIARLTRVRSELARILEHRVPAHLPPGFEEVGRDLSDRQRDLLVVYGSLLSERSLADFRGLLLESDELDEQFEALPADADEATINHLAEQMVPAVRRSHEQYPDARNPSPTDGLDAEQVTRALGEAVVQLYNRAQLKVLARMNTLLTEDSTG